LLKILSRLGFGTILAFLVLLTFELGLRIAGYKGPSITEDPYLGFEDIYPLFGEKETPEGKTVYATNLNKLRMFNYQEFEERKPPGVFRIFCFGGSTTYGRPLMAQTAYPRWLEILLNDMDPGRHYEVINAGGISYASYRIVNIINESLRYEPDLFIVYTGDNEFLERRTYQDILERSSALRLLSRNLSRFRIYDLLRQVTHRYRTENKVVEKPVLPGEVETILDHFAGLDLYSRRVNQKPQTFRHFSNNLSRIADIAHRREIPLILVNVVSNIADFSPFKSEHREDLDQDEYLAWVYHFRNGLPLLTRGEFEASHESFEQSYEIDPDYAELSYLMGRSALALGKTEEALNYFQHAREEDVCPLRATDSINVIITRIGKGLNLPIVDMRIPFSERNVELVGHPILGNALFFDHLHPTIEGHQLIANHLAQSLIQLGIVDLSRDWNPEATRQQFDDALNSLDDKYFAEGNLNLGKVLLWARKVEEAFVPLRAAAERIPENPDVHFTLGTCLAKLGRIEEAIKEFRKTLVIDPRHTEARNNLGLELGKSGDLDGAMEQFQKVVDFDPQNEKVLNNMGLVALSSGELERAETYFQRILEFDSRNAESFNNLGLVEMARGKFREAEERFREASISRPNYKEALNNLAVACLQQGKTGEAITTCKETLHMFPYSPELHNNLGEAYVSLKKYEEAQREFAIALSLRPGWERAQNNLDALHLYRDNSSPQTFEIE
jgi:tetratricopeptide (TPR) repeat protein